MVYFFNRNGYKVLDTDMMAWGEASQPPANGVNVEYVAKRVVEGRNLEGALVIYPIRHSYTLIRVYFLYRGIPFFSAELQFQHPQGVSDGFVAESAARLMSCAFVGGSGESVALRLCLPLTRDGSEYVRLFLPFQVGERAVSAKRLRGIHHMLGEMYSGSRALDDWLDRREAPYLSVCGACKNGLGDEWVSVQIELLEEQKYNISKVRHAALL